jgi:NAD(P)H-hydrate epimerase
VHGIPSTCFLLGDTSAVRGDAAATLGALRALGSTITPVAEGALGSLERALGDATLIVDGIFGTGLDRPIEGWRADVIAKMNASDAAIAALDLPSGVDADSGAILGVAVEAALTVTFAAEKHGLWQMPGRGHAGEIVCADIGVPAPSSRDGVLELRDAARMVPRRRLDAHKGTAGRVLVVAGSPGRTGAAWLSGYGAMRGGGGLVTIAARGAARDALDKKVIELMTMALPDDTTRARAAALEAARESDSAVVGPGLGLDEGSKALACALARELPVAAVLDADALTAVAYEGVAILRDAAAPRVLTPHPGEAARLLACSVADVQANRYASARRLAEQSGQIVVLKGAGTVVAEPGGRLAVCPLGTPALGVGGTGDVLSGVVAAALASARDPFSAACAAVVLHARAGELAARSDRGLLAREVADRLPDALEEARAGA